MEREFEAVDLTGEPLPELTCHECAKGARVHVPTGTVTVHCKHNEVGAWRVRGEWTISPRPISVEVFAQRMRIMLALAKLQIGYERSNNPTH